MCHKCTRRAKELLATADFLDDLADLHMDDACGPEDDVVADLCRGRAEMLRDTAHCFDGRVNPRADPKRLKIDCKPPINGWRRVGASSRR